MIDIPGPCPHRAPECLLTDGYYAQRPLSFKWDVCPITPKTHVCVLRRVATKKSISLVPCYGFLFVKFCWVFTSSTVLQISSFFQCAFIGLRFLSLHGPRFRSLTLTAHLPYVAYFICGGGGSDMWIFCSILHIVFYKCLIQWKASVFRCSVFSPCLRWFMVSVSPQPNNRTPPSPVFLGGGCAVTTRWTCGASGACSSRSRASARGSALIRAVIKPNFPIF